MRYAFTIATALCVALPLSAAAGHVTAHDAAIMVSPAGDAAMVLMRLENAGADDDLLIGVEAGDFATAASLQTHVVDADGAARVVPAEDGIALPAGTTHVIGRAGDHALGRDGDHAILLALAEAPEGGETVSLTLRFERGEDLTVSAPVQLHPTAARD